MYVVELCVVGFIVLVKLVHLAIVVLDEHRAELVDAVRTHEQVCLFLYEAFQA